MVIDEHRILDNTKWLHRLNALRQSYAEGQKLGARPAAVADLFVQVMRVAALDRRDRVPCSRRDRVPLLPARSSPFRCDALARAGASHSMLRVSPRDRVPRAVPKWVVEAANCVLARLRQSLST